MAAIEVTAGHNSRYGALTPARPWPDLAARVRGSTRSARVAADGLLVAMAIGAVALWTIVPAGALWIAARVGAGSAGYLLALVLIPRRSPSGVASWRSWSGATYA